MTDPKWWDMTIPKNSIANVNDLIGALDNIAERYVIGEEIGKDGYQHYQIRTVMPCPRAMSTVINLLEEQGIEFHGWLTPTHVRNFDYCEKEGKFIRSWEKVLREYVTLKLLPWQEQAEAFMHAQNQRQVLVIYDPIGNHGKTWFAKYMQATHQAQYVPPMNDAMDFMAFCLEKPSKAYIFDMPRAESIKQRKGMWSAVEQIKNGYIYDKRYKFRDQWIAPPTVCVFCNELPDEGVLSADRWFITQIQKYPAMDEYMLGPVLGECRATP